LTWAGDWSAATVGISSRSRDIESRHNATGAIVIVLGIVLLIIGFIAKVPIIWTLGVIAIVIGAVLALLGVAGREVGGRRHWY
jgi:uncharacterized membrane protein HdeD (DUF308 family)